jgi:hypothetical protein
LQPSLLVLLPKALQINCLKFMDIKEIGRTATASACRGLLYKTWGCSVYAAFRHACACREQSAVHGIATTTNPERWIRCHGDGCRMSG